MKIIFSTIQIYALLIAAYPASSQDSIPDINKQIVEYVKTTIGHKVDRGECWDLANKALEKVGADWNHEYVYGQLVDPKKDIIYPGYIIQFEGVKVKYKNGNVTYTENMEHHTAIVYKVLSRGLYELAHQNTSFSGRKVGLSTLDINTIIKGRMMVYKPIKKP